MAKGYFIAHHDLVNFIYPWQKSEQIVVNHYCFEYFKFLLRFVFFNTLGELTELFFPASAQVMA